MKTRIGWLLWVGGCCDRKVEGREYLRGVRPIDNSFHRFFELLARDNQFYPKTSAFENLKSIGLDLLSNDSLRLRITSLFELDYARLVNLGHYQENKSDVRGLMEPFISKYCRVTDQVVGGIPENTISEGQPFVPYYALEVKDPEKALADDELAIAVDLAIHIRATKIYAHQKYAESTGSVIEHLEKEIERLGGNLQD